MSEWRIAAHPRIAEIDAAEWDRLLACDQPFVRHAFLDALEESGSVREALGWRPWHLCLYQGDTLRAAAPAYLKNNSHGEFVFDHAWAEAYQRHRLDYYPKLLIAVPYSPVPGPRLLAGAGPEAASHRRRLLDAITQLVERGGLSGAHINFPNETHAAAGARDPWLPRHDWQFHFESAGARDFADVLERMLPKKRKNIRQERDKVRRLGLDIECREGASLSESELDQIHALYAQTFERKWNTPALTRRFFSEICQRMPESLVLMLAREGDSIVAMALCLRDSECLYGRYWGALTDLPGLHFELCYYQGIEYCLRHGLKRFEPGAQGEHKLARGFLPRRVRSLHYIAHPGFRAAIRRNLGEEHAALARYHDALLAHSPFRSGDPVDHD